MRFSIFCFAARVVVLLACGPAGAQTIVSLGKGYAHDCFIYAKAGTDPFDGVEVCNQALKDEVLTTKDRAATLRQSRRDAGLCWARPTRPRTIFTWPAH